ncbi:MAG: Fe2+-dependent dioxygenase [Azospirillaceae bacterium]|nr:Fe2+-dependent dioxygenase [Azospirillaceae bacterium]
MMLHIPQVLTPAELKHCRDVMLQSRWIEGQSTSGEQARKAKLNLQLPVESPEARELGEIVLRALGRNPEFNSAALPLRVLPPMFNRYDQGMNFGSHVDGAIRVMPGGGPRMRADVSSTLFLNDPENYDGGGLIIEGGFEERPVRLPAGDMIVYPTQSLHRVETITRGSRLAAFFWTQSIVKNHAHRDLLYQLDKAIRQLRMRVDDADPAILSLTNSYHNLLQEWAEL